MKIKKPKLPEKPKTTPHVIDIGENFSGEELNGYLQEFNTKIDNIEIFVDHEKEIGYYQETYCLLNVYLKIYSDEDLIKLKQYKIDLDQYNIDYNNYLKSKIKK